MLNSFLVNLTLKVDGRGRGTRIATAKARRPNFSSEWRNTRRSIEQKVSRPSWTYDFFGFPWTFRNSAAKNYELRLRDERGFDIEGQNIHISLMHLSKPSGCVWHREILSPSCMHWVARFRCPFCPSSRENSWRWNHYYCYIWWATGAV